MKPSLWPIFNPTKLYRSKHLVGRQFAFSYLNIVDPGQRNVSAVHDLQFAARLISRSLTSHVAPSAGQGRA